MRLQDKVAIITGAGRGIGRATAIKFATEGAKVVVCDLEIEWIDETVRLCKETRGDAMGYVADVREIKALEVMVAATMAKWGRVDCLVNNAGIVRDAQLKNMTEDQFDRVIEINLKGAFNCTKAVVNIMLAQQSGVILNASSAVALSGNFGQTNYAAAKAGLIGMMKTWARELGSKGIRSNAVCPGVVATDILKSVPDRVMRALEEKIPMGRVGRPEEIANTFAWLASDEASYINGAVIEVTGGLAM